MFEELNKLRSKYPDIIDVRGKGLLIGIEFSSAYDAAGIKKQLFSMGFLVSSIGKGTIRIAPPLIITERDAKSFIKAIQKMMEYTQTLNMSTSICYWVRKQLQIPTSLIPMINKNGFQCLGYQSKLFEK